LAGRKVLITGSTGLLGLSLIKNKPAGIDLYCGYYKFPEGQIPYKQLCGYRELDIRNGEEVSRVFRDIRPDAVIHAASLGNVDYCEKNKEEARQVNIEGSRNIIAACKSSGSSMIFMSSNAVFDGKNPPYGEGDPPNPVDYYGSTKLQTELDVAESGLGYAILRLMTMYGWNHPLERQNPITWVLERLIKNKNINIVNDIYNNHLFADAAAQAVWAVVSGDKRGIYHIAGSETVSRYELACRTAEAFGLDKRLIRPVDSSFFPSIAPRPKNTSYKIEKMREELRIKPLGIRAGLTLMKGNPPKEWEYGWY